MGILNSKSEIIKTNKIEIPELKGTISKLKTYNDWVEQKTEES